MSTSNYSKPGCPDCEGSGLVPCECNCPTCDEEVPCEWCDGTGFDPKHIDTAAYKEACEKAFGVRSNWYRENQRGPNTAKTVGRQSLDGKVIVRAADYTHAKVRAREREADQLRPRKDKPRRSLLQPSSTKPMESLHELFSTYSPEST